MKVLYIQHAGSLGGSCTSLLNTMRGVRDQGHEGVVALAHPDPAIARFFSEAGFEVLASPQIVTLNHSTVAPQSLLNPMTYAGLFRVVWGWKRARAATLDLVRKVRPDIVHLNSAPLVACAAALSDAGVRFVWHVREPPPDHGFRTRLIRRYLMRADQLIFISAYDREQWVGSSSGEVIANFVDLTRLRQGLDKTEARSKLGLAAGQKVILFMGGPGYHKGGLVLLRALAELKSRLPSMVCLAPATLLTPATSRLGKLIRRCPPLAAKVSPAVAFDIEVQRLGLRNQVKSMAFQTDVDVLYASADLLVFPATVPHFARPVIEASAHGVPSIGSAVGGVDDLIEDGVTGRLVPPNNPRALAIAMEQLLTDPVQWREMSGRARETANRRFSQDVQVRQIVQSYQRLFQ